MFSVCEIFCPICQKEMDWMNGYGKDLKCCGKKCSVEFEWRRTLAIMGKEYYPDPRQPEEK